MASLNPQDQLRSTLHRIDGRGYKAYKDLRGGYDFGRYALLIDHVQGDPFAAPSLLRLRLPQTMAKFPPDLFQSRPRRIALEDYLTRGRVKMRTSCCARVDADRVEPGLGILVWLLSPDAFPQSAASR